MSTYFNRVTKPVIDGIYWYELKLEGIPTVKLACVVLSYNDNTSRAEIKFLASDDSCIWIETNKLYEAVR